MIELCCGTGAVTDAFLKRGWTCLGVDVRRDPRYRGIFILADARSLVGADYRGLLDAVWASPPCTEFFVGQKSRDMKRSGKPKNNWRARVRKTTVNRTPEFCGAATYKREDLQPRFLRGI